MHCCLSERKAYNPFYALLAQRLIKDNPQSYKYSYKYTLWDYIKELPKYDQAKISNLAKMTGHLISTLSIPLHFLKIIDFDGESELSMESSVNIQLFVYLTLENFVLKSKKDKIPLILEQGIPEKYSADFGKGICHYIADKFYTTFKKRNPDVSPEMKTKIKVVFGIIQKKSESEFLFSKLK